MIDEPLWVTVIVDALLIVALVVYTWRRSEPYRRRSALHGVIWLLGFGLILTTACILVDDWWDVAAGTVLGLWILLWPNIEEDLDKRADRMID